MKIISLSDCIIFIDHLQAIKFDEINKTTTYTLREGVTITSSHKTVEEGLNNLKKIKDLIHFNEFT
jgi:hypothetical protein